MVVTGAQGMARTTGRIVALAALCVALAACSNKEPNLMNVKRGQDTPDEFAILPNKPIQMPEDLTTLPAPTPGAQNRADQTPFKDAVAVLGGNPDRLNRTGELRGDPALIGHTTRYGMGASIRQDLAAADLEFRSRNKGRILERLANVNTYYRAYEPMSLDQHAELRRFRRAGVRTPSAPPDPAAE